MGRKNKVKSSKKGSKDAKGGPNISKMNPVAAPASDGLAFLNNNQRREIVTDTSSSTPLFPPKPNMSIDGVAMQKKLLSLPAKKRSVTAERLVRANDMVDEIETLQTSRQSYYDSSENFVDIGTLKNDPSYIRECILWVRAYISSDFRVGISPQLLHGSPMPSCWTHITSLRPLDDNSPQLMHLDALSFVVLLATAIRLSGQDRFSLQIVHELHSHADGNYDWLDFEELQEHDETRGVVDESYLRFALAWVGVKRARALYRDHTKRTASPFQSAEDIAVQSGSLLKSIETFAKEQMLHMPKSPVGKWNLGWMTSQVKHNGKHSWGAAVEYYNLMADCCLLANEADDDFYRAMAGIEVAMALILGGKPLVGYSTPSGAKVQALRQAVPEESVLEGGTIALKINAPNPSAAREAGAKEQRRLQQGTPPTQLEPGESVLVPHWEVTRIWNFAMDAYIRVETFGHGQYIFGETTGWDIAEAILSGQHGRLIPNNYLSSPQVGFKSTRDKGSWPCDYCGKVESNLKQCSVCKEAQYCSRDCQKRAWKVHKKRCIPVTK